MAFKHLNDAQPDKPHCPFMPRRSFNNVFVALNTPSQKPISYGSALAVNWAQQNARALLEAWYPGQSGGKAIAETLSGKNNPAGRMPVTFYTGIDQLPAFDDYSMANRTYRYFKGKPLYAFGDGLSYTTFAYSGVKLSAKSLKAGDTLTVEADVKNNGPLPGDEVAELYLTPPNTPIAPKLALAGFERFRLNPGETRHLTFTLNPRTLSQVDEKGIRAVTPGTTSFLWAVPNPMATQPQPSNPSPSPSRATKNSPTESPDGSTAPSAKDRRAPCFFLFADH